MDSRDIQTSIKKFTLCETSFAQGSVSSDLYRRGDYTSAVGIGWTVTTHDSVEISIGMAVPTTGDESTLL